MTGSGVALEYATWTVVRHAPYTSAKEGGLVELQVSHKSTCRTTVRLPYITMNVISLIIIIRLIAFNELVKVLYNDIYNI